jgi:anti-sigma factor ChrR (cupin superfamily)
MPLTSPTHHPSAQVLANLLIGDCSPGVALLATRHVEACRQCAARVHAMGAVGGSASPLAYDPPQTLRPGLEIAGVQCVSGLGEAVVRLRVGPGEAIPLDALPSTAEILVLDGSLTAADEAYAPGDFLSLEEQPLRELFSGSSSGCVCLVALQDDAGVD